MEVENFSDALYEAVMEPAGNFHPDLAWQFSLLASHCENESEYIEKLHKLIHYYKKEAEYLIQDIFQTEAPSIYDFRQFLDLVAQKLEQVKDNPVGGFQLDLDL